jgi:AbrB family looped-hinge helix DNA binding protein
MATTRLSERGQVVIPVEIRNQLGLERGDRFEVEVNGDQVVLKRLSRNPLLELRGAFKGPNSLTDALLKDRRWEIEHDERRFEQFKHRD